MLAVIEGTACSCFLDAPEPVLRFAAPLASAACRVFFARGFCLRTAGAHAALLLLVIPAFAALVAFLAFEPEGSRKPSYAVAFSGVHKFIAVSRHATFAVHRGWAAAAHSHSGHGLGRPAAHLETATIAADAMRGAGLEQRGPFVVAACMLQRRPARRWACTHSAASGMTTVGISFHARRASAPARTQIHFTGPGSELARTGPTRGAPRRRWRRKRCRGTGPSARTCRRPSAFASLQRIIRLGELAGELGGRQTRQTRTQASRAPHAARNRTAVRAVR